MQRISIIVVSLAIAAAPLIALGITGVTPIPTTITTFSGLVKILGTVADVIFTLLMVVAVIFILMAAFHYLTAGGDASKIGSAHQMVIYAAVAIAVGALAKAIPVVVRQIVG